jgi:hypothetical protein
MARQAQFGLGLNPSNTSYTTGIGSREVVPSTSALAIPAPLSRRPDHARARATQHLARRTDGSEVDKAGIYPAWENWPWAESNFNMREPPMNEHVVGGNMANLLMTWAYLAQAMSADKQPLE